MEGAQVNGQIELPIVCTDPDDCVRKCEFFDRHARDGGLPAPAACALCRPPCPDNLGTTVIDFMVGIREDIQSALRLVGVCAQSVTACVCQVFMMLKPGASPLRCCPVPEAV